MVILPKYGTCIDCVINGDFSEKSIIANRCRSYHYPIYRNKKMLEKSKEKIKVRTLKNTPANLEMAYRLNGDKGMDRELEVWFLLHMNTSEMICENCGKSLHSYNQTSWRSSIHHVLDKAIFPSVKTNPINKLILGMWCGCHSQWHTSMLNASKMPVFAKAKEIVEILYPILPHEEKIRVSPYYGIKSEDNQAEKLSIKDK